MQVSIVVPWQFTQYTGGVYDAPSTCPTSPPSAGPTCAQFGSIACIADQSTGTGCAQHGVTIVGYDDTLVDGAGAPGALRIMNSFGTGWGEGGVMWMSYATFEAIYLAGTLAEPPPPSTLPGMIITEAFQSVEHRAGPSPRVHLVFQTRFERPVRLGEVSITSPDGSTVVQTHGHSFRSGHLYITRHDGRQFEPGLYTLRARGTTRGGLVTDHTATVRVEPAAGEALAPAPLPPGVTGTNGGPVR